MDAAFPSHNPIPPGIFGYEEGKISINPYVYNWDAKQGATRKPLEEARQLLAEAGYPGGQDKNGNPLIVILITTDWTASDLFSGLVA